MKEIQLTQGKVALVDDQDYEYLNRWKWCAHKNRKTFYADRSVVENGKRTTVAMHQVLARLMEFKHTADHINRNGLDNRRDNLRDATSKQNQENCSVREDNTSGHIGVCWHKLGSKWEARIQNHGNRIYLGLFEKLEDAVRARNKAEKKYFTH